jgi:hypothetical protein
MAAPGRLLPDGFWDGDGGEQPFLEIVLQVKDMQMIAGCWNMRLTNLQPSLLGVITFV